MFGWLKFGWIKKVPKVLKAVLRIANDPRVAAGLEIAALIVPGAQALLLRKVLYRVRIAENVFGTGTGLDKFNDVFTKLINDPDIKDNKELRDLIEKAVMIINGTIIALDVDGNKI